MNTKVPRLVAFENIGPSGVRALPVAAGTNVVATIVGIILVRAAPLQTVKWPLLLAFFLFLFLSFSFFLRPYLLYQKDNS